MFRSLQAKANLPDTPAEQVSSRLFQILPDHHYEIHQRVIEEQVVFTIRCGGQKALDLLQAEYLPGLQEKLEQLTGSTRLALALISDPFDPSRDQIQLFQ
ncbi:MAG: hypothetical protein HC921_06000 [Synechococcaceae cyanobacterium SM2_3_1]|nr:hypothetical protein [Synechococcaceae cyanobacterium SM2_3_1]